MAEWRSLLHDSPDSVADVNLEILRKSVATPPSQKTNISNGVKLSGNH
jgi:hypothetical protein